MTADEVTAKFREPFNNGMQDAAHVESLLNAGASCNIFAYESRETYVQYVCRLHAREADVHSANSLYVLRMLELFIKHNRRFMINAHSNLGRALIHDVVLMDNPHFLDCFLKLAMQMTWTKRQYQPRPCIEVWKRQI